MSGCPRELIFASERGVNRMYNDMMDTIGLVEKATRSWLRPWTVS